MATQVCIFTSDRTFGQLLRLELSECRVQVSLVSPGEALPPAALYVVDLDSATPPPAARCIVFSREEQRLAPYPVECRLRRPFRMEKLFALCDLPQRGGTPGTPAPGTLLLQPRESLAFFDGRCVKLAPREAALLEVLCRAQHPLTREEICRSVWGEDADPGVVAVYLHYLRRKLEGEGVRLIAYRSGKGYSLTVKGVVEC